MPESSPVEGEVTELVESCRRWSVLGGEFVLPSSIESVDRRPYDAVLLWDNGTDELILLTSTPRNVLGASPATAFGTPQIANRRVANQTDRTNGANIMDVANSKLPSAHAVSKVGFRFLTLFNIGSRLRGGRAVYPAFSLSSGF